MSKKIWTFASKDGNHAVELDHGFWSGKREITIDGVPLESSSKIWDTGSVHHFEVSGVPCVLQIKGNLLSFKYNLYVDGKLINSPR